MAQGQGGHGGSSGEVEPSLAHLALFQTLSKGRGRPWKQGGFLLSPR